MRRVLVVDDTEDLRVSITVALERTGEFVVVGEAADGVEAIALAGELQPDVIVLDHMMPNMTGLEAISPIRSVAPDSKVILFSAVVHLLEIGAGDARPDRAVLKDGDIHSLIEAVATV